MAHIHIVKHCDVITYCIQIYTHTHITLNTQFLKNRIKTGKSNIIYEERKIQKKTKQMQEKKKNVIAKVS